ncbi:hypothetical protein [Actinoplanes sp. NPDC049265]|uniref:hypothetical protein n=1 Tax=Actinoplanes sp. NPDC049265 TaxID=3363902 RepID=UPI003719B174
MDQHRLIDVVRRLAATPAPCEPIRSVAGPIQVVWSSGLHTLVSFSRVDVAEGAELALLTGTVLAADTGRAAVAHAPDGTFHAGFPGRLTPPPKCRRWARRREAERRAMDEVRDAAPEWLERLRDDGRVGRTEGDVAAILRRAGDG